MNKPEKLSIKRILQGRLSLARYRISWGPVWTFSIRRYWGGRLIYLTWWRFSVCLDCRKNCFEDMRTGRIE